MKRSYYVAPNGSVHRRVVRTFGGNRMVTTSDVPVAPDVESFREAHPNVPLENEVVTRPGPENAPSPQDVVEGLTDEELAALGLQRAEPSADEDPESFPVARGSGWYELSNGERVRGEQEAFDAEVALHTEE